MNVIEYDISDRMEKKACSAEMSLHSPIPADKGGNHVIPVFLKYFFIY